MRKKLKLNKDELLLAQRYEAAWHTLFYTLPPWKKDTIIQEPHGRHADELAHEAAILAENSKNELKIHEIMPSGHNI